MCFHWDHETSAIVLLWVGQRSPRAAYDINLELPCGEAPISFDGGERNSRHQAVMLAKRQGEAASEGRPVYYSTLYSTVDLFVLTASRGLLHPGLRQQSISRRTLLTSSAVPIAPDSVSGHTLLL
jgi:hypothetical protein